MIVKTPNDWAPYLEDHYGDIPAPIQPTLHEPHPERATEVLGPDGEPVAASVPRARIGFDLTPRR